MILLRKARFPDPSGFAEVTGNVFSGFGGATDANGKVRASRRAAPLAASRRARRTVHSARGDGFPPTHVELAP